MKQLDFGTFSYNRYKNRKTVNKENNRVVRFLCSGIIPRLDLNQSVSACFCFSGKIAWWLDESWSKRIRLSFLDARHPPSVETCLWFPNTAFILPLAYRLFFFFFIFYHCLCIVLSCWYSLELILLCCTKTNPLYILYFCEQRSWFVTPRHRKKKPEQSGKQCLLGWHRAESRHSGAPVCLCVCVRLDFSAPCLAHWWHTRTRD